CSSTTTRMRRTARSPPRIRFGRHRTRACRRRSHGTRWTRRTRATSRSARCRRGCAMSAIRTTPWTRTRSRSTPCSSSPPVRRARPRRCAVAAALPPAARRAGARTAVAETHVEEAGDRSGAREEEERRARRARAVEGAASDGGEPPPRVRRPRRRHARTIHHVDANPRQPGARAGGAAAGAGTDRRRRRLRSAEDARQLVGRRHLELIVAALARRFVRTPAQKHRRVAEAIALHVVVLHLGDALDAQRFPRQVLARAPSTLPARHALTAMCVELRPLFPRMIVERMRAERLELLRELAPPRHRERRGDADVVQPPAVVVQPEQQRSDELVLPRLVPAKTRDDAIRRARVLDLEHRALARLVYTVFRLRHDAVEARAFETLQPLGRDRDIARHRRQMNRRRHTVEQPLERRAPPGLW